MDTTDSDRLNFFHLISIKFDEKGAFTAKKSSKIILEFNVTVTIRTASEILGQITFIAVNWKIISKKESCCAGRNKIIYLLYKSIDYKAF